MIAFNGMAFADPPIWMPDYFEGANFPFTKHFGTLTHSYRNRVYTENNTAVPNANWVMIETGGDDGSYFQAEFGIRTFSPTPYLTNSVWYMNTSTDGSVREVADHLFDENGPVCFVNMPYSKSITWSSPGIHQVGDTSTNIIKLTGTCGNSNATGTWELEDYYPSFTIPAITSTHGWSCPAATFVDVIKIRNRQQFSATSFVDTSYWYAKGFGAIKIWGDDGYVLRRVCDADDNYSCQCAEGWMAGTGGPSNPPTGGEPGSCGPGTGIVCP